MRSRLLTSILCLPFLAFPQQASSPDSPHETVFSVGTTLVQIDAEVTDSKGRHVTNLTASDFQVILDHKPQPITNFSYVSLHNPNAAATDQTPGENRSRAASFVVRPESVRHCTVFVVDDLGLSFQSMELVRRALRKFVADQMQPDDLIAIWETGRTNSVFQQLTSDKHTLEAGINALTWNPRGEALLDAFKSDQDETRHESPNPFQLMKDPGERDERTYIKSSLLGGAIGVINELIAELRTVGGRKAVVLFADGLQLPAANLDGERLGSVLDQELIDDFRHLIDNANRSGTVIHTIDARGLEYVTPQRTPNLMASQQGLLSLAEETGGIGVINANTFTDALQKIEDDQKGYYLIGFKPPPGLQDKPGSKKVDFHLLKVALNRPDLHIRSRKGFWGETDELAQPKYNTPQAQMQLAALSLFNRSDIHVRLTPLYTRTPDGTPVARNLIFIDARDIAFKKNLTGKNTAALDIMILPTLPGNGSLTPVSRKLELSATEAQLESLRAAGILLSMNVPLKQSGPYQIRASVRDNNSAAMGSAGQYIQIPNLRRQHLALTTPVLKNSSLKESELTTPALREFHAGSNVSFVSLVETDRDTTAKLDASAFAAEVQLYSQGKSILNTTVPVADVQGQNVHAVKGELRLKDSLDPGQYYLEVTAQLTQPGKPPHQANTWIDFQVVK